MGFDTIEINLVETCYYSQKNVSFAPVARLVILFQTLQKGASVGLKERQEMQEITELWEEETYR